jgi:hypothetical protein
VASRSGDRPAIIPSSHSTHHFARAAHGEARCAGRFSRRHEATRYIREGERHLSRQERLLPSLKATVVNNHGTARMAKDILASFEMAQSVHLNDRVRLLLALLRTI